MRASLASGAAREKLRQMIAWQGGDPAWSTMPTRLPSATHSHDDLARHESGYVTTLDALLVGRAAVALGAGRDKKSDPVDLSAGILLRKKPGDAVAAGEPVMRIALQRRIATGTRPIALATQAVVIGDQAPADGAAGHGLGARRRRADVR